MNILHIDSCILGTGPVGLAGGKTVIVASTRGLSPALRSADFPVRG